MHSIIFGRHDVFSFEIVVKNGLIYFYIAIPPEYCDYITEQLHAQFPLAQVSDAVDYNIFSARGFIKAGYARLTRSSIFPIKTYKKLESDPLNSLTNVLSKIGKEDGAAIQIMMRPIGDGWRKYSSHIASAVQSGKKLSQVMSESKLSGQALSILKAGGAVKKQETVQQPRLSPLEEESVKNLN